MKSKILKKSFYDLDKIFGYEEPKLPAKEDIWCEPNFWLPVDRPIDSDLTFCSNCFGNNVNPVPMSEIL